MAVAQGICKNCGSLIVYNTADTECECIFCNAVFPLSEAISIDAELKDIVFPNEKFEKQDSSKHHYVMPVYDDQVKVNVEREERSKTLDPEVKEKVTYELQAKDVKAPKNVVIALTAISAVIVIIIAAISVPLYISRTNLNKKMKSSMGTVVSNVITVDTSIDEDGFAKGYFIAGNKCQVVKIVTKDEVNDSMAKQIFTNYCEQRKNASSSIKSDNDVEMTIYCANGIYEVTTEDSAVFHEDSKPLTSESK